MADHALYLFKAARRPLYLKENLRLLAAERGTVVEVAYNRSWVAPEYFDAGAIPRGAPAYFIFSDRPFDVFVPVREGEVVASRSDELMLRIRVLLKNWVGVEDVDLATFTRLVRQADPDRVPGKKFVARKRDGVQFVAYYDEREDDGWRRAVENTLDMSRQSKDDPYRRSIFFRPAGLRVGDGPPLVARRVPLEPGARASLLLRFYNPHLSDDDAPEHTLRALAPEDELRVESPDRVPRTGELELPVEFLGGRPSLTLQIAPAPAQHTHVVERFSGEDEERADAAEAGRDPSARRTDLLEVYDFVRRNTDFDDAGDEIDFFDLFQRLLPGEQRIAEDRGLRYHERGEAEGAFRILRELDPEIMGDDARFLLFRLVLRYGRDRDPVHQLGALGLSDEGRFDRLLDELDALDARVLARLVPGLVEDLAVDQVRDLMNRVGDRLKSPDAIAVTCRNLYYVTGDAQWAYDYVRERRTALHVDDPVLHDALLELAEAGGRTGPDPELAEDAERRIGHLIARDDVDEARALLRQAGDAVGRRARDRLYHRVTDRLAGKGRHDEAAEVMVELAYAACETGDLPEATEAAQRARGEWAGVADAAEREAPDWLVAAIDTVETAWRDCRELVEWRETDEQRRREILRKMLLNERILIAGGFEQQDWAEKLAEMTGAAIDWAERYRDEGGDLDAYAAKIRNGSYALVVHYWQKSGHEVRDTLKPACEAADVPYRPAHSAGYRGILGAVAEGIGESASTRTGHD